MRGCTAGRQHSEGRAAVTDQFALQASPEAACTAAPTLFPPHTGQWPASSTPLPRVLVIDQCCSVKYDINRRGKREKRVLQE